MARIALNIHRSPRRLGNISPVCAPLSVPHRREPREADESLAQRRSTPARIAALTAINPPGPGLARR